MEIIPPKRFDNILFIKRYDAISKRRYLSDRTSWFVEFHEVKKSRVVHHTKNDILENVEDQSNCFYMFKLYPSVLCFHSLFLHCEIILRNLSLSHFQIHDYEDQLTRTTDLIRTLVAALSSIISVTYLKIIYPGTLEQLGIWYGHSIETIVFIVF